MLVQFFLLLLLSISNSEICDFVNSTTSTKSLSCVEETKRQLYEKCFDAHYCTEKNNFDSKTLPECPFGFIDSEDICYKFSNKSSFPPTCPFKNVLPFESYESVLQEHSVPVWMPVQRNLTNGLGFLQWMEASSRYKTVFDDNYFFDGGINGKDCLLYYNNSYIVAVSCKEEHPGVCAYKKVTRWRNPLCGDFNTCIQKSLNPNFKCVCVEMSSNLSSYTKAEFLEPYENNVFGILRNKTCSIGLEKVQNGTFIWSSSSKIMDYTYWAPETIFSDKYSNVAATSVGWILTDEPLSCVLVEKDIDMNLPRLKLSISDDMEYELILNISFVAAVKEYNGKPLIYCYTDADPQSLLYRFSDMKQFEETDSYIVYKFDPIDQYSGYYWCEGFSYFDSESISSNVVFLESNEFLVGTLPASLRLTYDDGINPLSPDIIHLLNNVLANSSCPYRVVTLTDLDESNKQISIIVAFACSREMWTEFNERQSIKEVSNKILTSLNNNFTEVIKFLEADNTCQPEVYHNLTWPETSVGECAYPREYCFKSDGQRLCRLCNFTLNQANEEVIDWIDVQETCEIPEVRSSKTSTLEFLSNLVHFAESGSTPWSTDFFQLLEISKSYSEFTAFDVYLTANFLDTVKTDGYWFYDVTVTDFLSVINNILNVDSDILRESQIKMCATEIILDLFNYNMILDTNEFNVHLANLAVVEGYNSGLTMTKVQNETVISMANTSIDDILRLENLSSAVWVEIPNEFDNWLLSTFFTNRFFPDDSLLAFESTTVSDIYRLVPNTIDAVESIYVIHRIDEDTYNKNVYCVYWDPDMTKWILDGKLMVIDANFVCQFSQIGTYALIFTPQPNRVTQRLSDIIASDSDSSAKLWDLQVVSEEYNDWTSADVVLAAAILEKVSHETKVNTTLEIINCIISNLLNINREVLQEAQTQNSATDTILYYIDQILLNYPYSSDFFIVSENSITAIYNLTNFYGFLLFENNEVIILNNTANITDLKNYDNLNSALVLSSELKNQYEEDAIIRLNVLYNDALFNEKNKTAKYTVFGKIHNILLPEIGTNFSGPLSIFHKIKTTSQPECSHWFYNISEDVNSFWANDSVGTMNFSLVQCDFWHTTHFGVLLFDVDKYENELWILDIITNITCSLSLIGFCGIILTAFLFNDWRSKPTNRLLLSFVVSGIFQEVVFFISGNVKEYSENYALCVFTGIVLHYSVLVQFSWMSIIGLFQYRQLILLTETQYRTQNITYVVLKSNLIAWGFSFLPVLIVVAANNENYTNSNVGICYPSGYALYLGVWWPVSVVIVINLIIFLFIIDFITNKKSDHKSLNDPHQENVDEIYYHIKRISLNFFLFGLTWIFGFLAEFAYSIIFVYLFDILSSLQGVILFLNYVVFDEKVKKLYHKKWFPKKTQKTSC